MPLLKQIKKKKRNKIPQQLDSVTTMFRRGPRLVEVMSCNSFLYATGLFCPMWLWSGTFRPAGQGTKFGSVRGNTMRPRAKSKECY